MNTSEPADPQESGGTQNTPPTTRGRKKPRKGQNARAGADAAEAAERKCIVSGVSGPKGMMIRFVVGPDGEVFPDLSEKLPGRGMWVTADEASLRAAVAKGLFARAARAKVSVDPQLPERVTDLLVKRAINQIGLAQKAGFGVAGFDKVEDCLAGGRPFILLEASDGAADGRNRLVKRAKRRSEAEKSTIHVVGLLDSNELSLAFGRQHVIHAALKAAPVAKMVLRDLGRLAGFRPMIPSSWEPGQNGIADPARNDGRKARSEGERNE